MSISDNLFIRAYTLLVLDLFCPVLNATKKIRGFYCRKIKCIIHCLSVAFFPFVSAVESSYKGGTYSPVYFPETVCKLWGGGHYNLSGEKALLCPVADFHSVLILFLVDFPLLLQNNNNSTLST